jgi:secreted PhoX family phosphatase
LKIVEENNDAGSNTFQTSTFILGGEESGFSSPDNLAIDKNGNLWMTTDISGSSIGQNEYAFHGNNSLFFIPLHGPWAGLATRVAVAPKDAEFTGPCFSPDGNSLFLSVQHPGETSKNMNALTSHWPENGNATPRSAVVILDGKTMNFLLGDEFRNPRPNPS